MNNRQKIVGAARELFHFFGYAGTSVDMLIASAGVSKSNFYYYFKSKEELGLWIVEDLISRYEREVILKTILNYDFTPLQRLDSFYKETIAYQRTLERYQGSFFGNLAQEQSGVNEKFRSVLSDFFRRWKKSVTKCIGDGVQKGFFNRKINPAAAADLVLSHVEGAILLSKTHKSMNTLDRSCQEMMKLIISQGKKK